MKFLSPLLIAVIFLLFSMPCSATSDRLAAATDSLNLALKTRKAKLEQRLGHIDSLKKKINESSLTSAAEFEEIAVAYRGLNTDSAIAYYNRAWRRAEASGDTLLRNRLLIDYAEQLPKLALFAEAIATMDSINPALLDSTAKRRFYAAKSHIYTDAANYHTLAHTKKQNTDKAISSLDTLAGLLSDNDPAKRIIMAQSHIFRGEETLAIGELNEALDNLPTSDPSYAIIASMIASIYKDKPDKKDEYLYYLTVSATADALNANGEEASLMLLGSELFSQGDIDRSFNYLSESAEALRESGARILISEITPPLSVFAETMRARENSRSILVTTLCGIMAITFIISGILIWRTHRKSVAKAHENEKLTTSVSMRDQYINQLLDICAVYVEGLEDFNRLVGRKLKANQIQDLYKMIESGKMMQDQTERFFQVFDTAIFNIFPDFINEINSLLLPDKQLSLPERGKLSPELRIVAFMRLGVTDSARLSKFLGLSLNTVYTYRNRLKGRAISRENFEDSVKRIDKSV